MARAAIGPPQKPVAVFAGRRLSLRSKPSPAAQSRAPMQSCPCRSGSRAEADMMEIRFRAERRLGELMAAQKGVGLLRPGGNGSNQHRVTEKPNAPITLSEAGIDKHLGSRLFTLTGSR